MAGDWLAIRLDIHDDPAVVAMAIALDMSPDCIVGKLTKLWSWANRHLQTGSAKGITSNWIDQYVHATGFASAMISSGWLQDRSGTIHFPKFDVWNSASAKRRLLETRRKQKKRIDGDVRILSASHADKNGTRGEERREEERREVGGGRERLDHPPDRPTVFPSEASDCLRSVAARAVEIYQTRRYKTPDPTAKYYPVLLQEAVGVFEAHSDCEMALRVFDGECRTSTLPVDASFSELAIACGLKRKKAKYQPPKSNIKDYTAERLAREAAERLAGQMAVAE